MKNALAAILIMLPLLLSQPSTGCTVAGSDLAASVANATACLEIPAGTYDLSGSSGVLLSSSAANLDIAGAGMRQTIIRVTGAMTLTSDLIVLRLLGTGQRVHDLTIQIDSAGIRGPWGVGGINVYASGERATIERIEVVGGYSSDGARGYGIGTYRLYSDHDGAQFVTIRDCYIHDGIATGIGINSNNNLILNNHIARVGLNSLSHGIYMQGGYNTYDGNTIEQATGYSFHGYKQVPSLDSSGDRIVNNTSINPGTGHALFQGQPNTANPTLPATANLNRHATVANNVFRGGANGVLSSNPIIVSNNVFEDVFGGTTISGGARSVITGNLIQQLSSTAGGTAIVARDLSVVADNQISTIGQVKAIDSQGAEVTIRDNVISMANAYARGIFIGGRDTWVDGNTIDASAAYDVIGFNNNLAGIRITNNRFNHTAGGQLANFGNLQTRAVSGVFQGNRLINGYIRYDVGSANFRMLDNSGSIVAYGVTSEGVGQP